MVRGLELLPNKGGLRRLELFSLEKRMLCGGLIGTFQCLKGGHTEAEEGYFFRNCSDGTESKGANLKRRNLSWMLARSSSL